MPWSDHPYVMKRTLSNFFAAFTFFFKTSVLFVSAYNFANTSLFGTNFVFFFQLDNFFFPFLQFSMEMTLSCMI